MRNGTQGFVPARLEQARTARGVTQTLLADRIKVSPASISKWEKGLQTPEPKTLNELSLALGMSPNFFLKPLPDYGSSQLFYRSMAAAMVTPRERMAVKFRWLQDISLTIAQHIEYPDLNLPELNYLPKEFYSIKDEHIEQAALDVRKHWGLGEAPIVDLILTLENAGIMVGSDDVGSQHLDGLSSWFGEDRRPYILLANDKHIGPRRRFDAAHELGHLILHRHIKVKFEDRSPEYLEVERQAHLFAGAFLLPRTQFASEVYAPTLDCLVEMKKRWKVSVAAMLKRCEQLEMLNAELKTRLWKYYSVRGWRRFEKYDDVIEIEQPRMLSNSIRLLLNEKVVHSDELLHGLALPTTEVEMLTALDQGYFHQYNSSSNNAIGPKLISNVVPWKVN